MSKPVDPWEVVAHVEAVLRRDDRGTWVEPERLKIGRLDMCPLSREAWIDGNAIVLAPKEYDLLATLIRLQGVALAWYQLLDLVWGTRFVSSEQWMSIFRTCERS